MLVFSLLLGIGIALSTTAQAQYPNDRVSQDRSNDDQNRRGRDWDQYGNYGGSFQRRQTRERWLHEGLSAGNYAVRTAAVDYRESDAYRRATKTTALVLATANSTAIFP